MIEERALAREESAGQLKGLCVPELALFLFNRRVKAHVLLHLDDESDLRAIAEVRDSQPANFLDERLPGEFQLILALLNQVFDFVWL